jgi:hypothetical protein
MATKLYFSSVELTSPTIPDGTYLNTTSVLLSPTPLVASLSGHNVYRKTLSTTMVNAVKLLTLNGTLIFNGMFFGRYQSAPLAAQTIPAQTWTIVPDQGEGSTGANTFHWPYLAIYRPSTQQVVGTFLDGSGSFGGVEWSGGITTGNPQNYACSAITCQDGDVLIYEAWAALQTYGTAVPMSTGVHSWGMDEQFTRIDSPYTLTFYTGPTGTNYPSVADKIDLSPMTPSATTDIAALSSVATPFILTPMTAFDATSTVTRAPVLTSSVASPTTYGPTAATAATALVAKTYTSTALPTTYAHAAPAAISSATRFSAAMPFILTPMTVFDATSTATRVVSSVASPTSYALAPVAATSSVSVAPVGVTSNALPTTYAHAAVLATSSVQGYSIALPIALGPVSTVAATSTAQKYSIASPATYAVNVAATPATDSVQGYSIALPITTYAVTAAPATATAARVFISSGDAAVFAPLAAMPANVNVTSAASPATFALAAFPMDVVFSGITNLYCVADPSNIVISGLKAGSLPKAGNNNVATGSGVDGVLSAFWGGTGNITNRTTTTVSNTNQQSNYFGRFISRPLAAQTIAAQNWNYAPLVGEGSTNAKTFFWPVMYVWRPSNSTVVGYVFDAAANAGTEWPATPATATRTIAGARVDGVQDGDVLVVEAWAVSAPTIAGVYTQTWRITDNTSKIVTQYKLLYLPSSILYFNANVPAYSPTAGSKASSLPKAQNTNWNAGLPESSLSETLVQAPVGRTVNSIANTTQQSLYFGRHSTPRLAAQTIPAQTWGWEVSAGMSQPYAHTYHWPVLYVWRPSNNSVVGYIFNASANYGIEWRINVDPQLNQQFAGAAVDVQDGDILVAEIWGVNTQTTGSSAAEQVWTTAVNASIVSPYKLVYYTGLKQSIQSSADPTTYDLVEADATSTYARGIIDTPSTALPAVYAHAAPAAVSLADRVSIALPLTYTHAPTAATSSVTRIYTSNAVATSYALAPVAATSAYVPTAGNVAPVVYTLVPVAAVSSVQGNSAALPLVYSFAATATGTGRGYASIANPGLYALAGAPGSSGIGGGAFASPGSFSQAVFPGLGRGELQQQRRTDRFQLRGRGGNGHRWSRLLIHGNTVELHGQPSVCR